MGFRPSVDLPGMVDLVIYAIPAFVLLLAVELLSFRYARDEELVGYESRDTRTSLAMGGGNVVINAVWKAAVVVIYVGLYELTPLRMPADEWWTYVLLFLADDLAYYWFHRIHHEVRVFWASHVVHHSSQHYNLSTALRQTWTPSVLPMCRPTSSGRLRCGSVWRTWMWARIPGGSNSDQCGYFSAVYVDLQ